MLIHDIFSTNAPASSSIPHGIVFHPLFLSKVSAFPKRKRYDGGNEYVPASSVSVVDKVTRPGPVINHFRILFVSAVQLSAALFRTPSNFFYSRSWRSRSARSGAASRPVRLPRREIQGLRGPKNLIGVGHCLINIANPLRRLTRVQLRRRRQLFSRSTGPTWTSKATSVSKPKKNELRMLKVWELKWPAFDERCLSGRDPPR